MTPEERAAVAVDTETAEDADSRMVPADLESRIAEQIRAAVAAERERCLMACEEAKPERHRGKSCGCGECTGAEGVAELIRGADGGKDADSFKLNPGGQFS